MLKRFGRLTAISDRLLLPYGHKGNKRAFYRCRCDCGIEAIVEASKLMSGHTQSCGCLRSEVVTQRNITHGESKTWLYKRWGSMCARCADPAVRYYGDRGITVCPEWQRYETFREWAIDNGAREHLTIDRVDCDKG